MAAPAQTVIYRLDDAHRPVWQYHSMPESAVGGGNSLDEAREQFRDALRFLLDTDELPEIREYIEREAHLGIWVRTLIDDPNADAVLQMVATQVSRYLPEDLDWFYRSPTAGGDPVVFHGDPNDPLASIFQQMTPFDYLILVAGYGDGAPTPQKLMWLVIAGPEAAGAGGGDLPVGFGEIGLTLNSPLSKAFALALQHHRLYGNLHANRPPALLALA
jgi:hypothetical protein